KISNPERTGYTFAGWSTDAGDDNEVNVNWDTVITESVLDENKEYKLYAVWTPNAETAYTVIFWKQNVNDKYDEVNNPNNNNVDATYTWDYSEAIRLKGETEAELTEDKINSALTAAISDDWKIGSMSEANYEGFQYLKNDSASKTISRNGDTVVNVYYTRKVVTLTFKQSNYSEYVNANNYKNNPNPELEYYRKKQSGGYEKVTYSISEETEITFYEYEYGEYYEYDGDIFYVSGTDYYGNNKYSKINKAKTVANVAYYGRYWYGWYWVYYRIYRKESTSNKVTWYKANGQKHTGDIYYKNPDPGSFTYKALYNQNFEQAGYEWPYQDEDGEYIKWTESDGTVKTFTDLFDKDETFTGSELGETYYTLKFYKQNADDDDYTLANTIYSEGFSSFTFENKYQGFNVVRANYGGQDHTVNVGDKVYNSQNINIYFDRLEYDLSFVDVNPETHAQETISTQKVRYGASLWGYKDTKDPFDYSNRGFAFNAWCYDVAGEKEFLFDQTTMPMSSLAIYGDWNPVSYDLYLDANGGTFNSGLNIQDDGRALLRMNYGEQIVRDEFMSTSFVSRDGWVLVGWYYQNEDGSAGEAFPYEPITTTTHLIAKWRFSDNLSVVFDGNEHGWFDEAQTEETYTDGHAYASNSSFVAAAAPSKVEKGYTFIGWQVVNDSTGSTYYPNGVVDIAEKMIDTEKKQVLVTAVYSVNGEDGPGSTPTFINYHSNDGKNNSKLVTTDDDGNTLVLNKSVKALTLE
ncbi:MAG: InlB B-repeat-containing protein, partial [Bacteroidaceae bacterium]|nr:InlB B-repeat-containing protein [Bacteroidaceae bacterium]